MGRLVDLVARCKPYGHAADLSGWGPREMASFAVLVVTRLLRGVVVRARIKCAGGPILCDRRVRLYHPWHISAGQWLNLEEGCEIVGLSKRGIVFGDRCTVGRYAVIRPTNVLLDEPGEGLRVGDHSNIGAYSYIGCSGYIEIGSRVLTGPRVNLLAENHCFEDPNRPIKEQGVQRSFIRIEDDCWIGAGTTILSGVTVGTGSVIGSGAVVTADVPPRSLAAGVPARVVRTRTQDGKSA